MRRPVARPICLNASSLRPDRLLLALILSITVTAALRPAAAIAADPPRLNGPVTALTVHGDDLLIGQEARLLLATITPDALPIRAALDLGHGAIRAIAVTDDGGALVLTEDGLIALDNHDTPTDFLPGGGYGLAVHGTQAAVAALAAGVRLYQQQAGHWRLSGQIRTAQPAEAVATDGSHTVWIAEGSAGIQAFATDQPDKPTLLYNGPAFAPAHLVRANGLHLLIGYGAQVALLDTINIAAPRQIATLTIDGSPGVFISDALFDQDDLLLGRVDVSGADVLHTRLDSAGSPASLNTYLSSAGTDGAGDRLARHGADLFVGSERVGLRRLRLTDNGATVSFATLATWPIQQFADCAAADFTPNQSQPANLSTVSPSAAVHLAWAAVCPAAQYRVLINGQFIATVDQPYFDYTLPAGQTHFTWQISAQPGTATTSAEPISGPLWTVRIEQAGYLSTPPAVSRDPGAPSVLYAPPPGIDLSALQTPTALLAESCLILLAGVALIVLGGWAIGRWSASRRG